MIRTRRSIEEEGRVRLEKETGSDSYVSDAGLLDKLYGGLLKDIYSFGAEQNKKALIVGCEDNGEIAINLARKGMFVVVVDDSKERLERVISRSQEEKLFMKMTFFETDCIKKEFTSGSFDFISLFSVLGRYNEPLTVIRKCKRELKVGGRILIRMKVKSLFPRLPGFLERIRVKINSLIFKDVAFDAVREKIAAEFKIERVVLSRLFLPAYFALKKKFGLGTFENKLSCISSDIDEKITPGRCYVPVTMYASFFALKELELGKTFRV